MFEYTQEGYKKAKEYLDSIGYFYNTQMDGYSLVHLANDVIESLQNRD